MKPALAAHEWEQKHLVVQAETYGDDDMPSRDCGAAEIYAGPNYLQVSSHEHPLIAVIDTPEQRHALAALALHGQPFGFTHQDARAIRDAAKCVERDTILSSLWEPHITIPEILSSVADRIESLLPPEPPSVQPDTNQQ